MPLLPPKPMWRGPYGSRIYHGDCVKILPKVGQFNFAFADPPFNIGQKYMEYEDTKEAVEYNRWTTWWIRMLWMSLKPNGVMALHGPDDLVKLYLQVEDTLKLTRIGWVNWHYRFGQCGRGNWIDARCHCLLYAKSKDYTWNPENVLVQSDRVKYGDKRVQDSDRGGSRLPGTVWGVPSDGEYWGRVQGNNKERRPKHPNQLPEKYLERLILAYTNPRDHMVDPFGGSGTSIVVARALGRKCTTMDVSLESCQSIQERVVKGAVNIKGAKI